MFAGPEDLVPAMAQKRDDVRGSTRNDNYPYCSGNLNGSFFAGKKTRVGRRASGHGRFGTCQATDKCEILSATRDEVDLRSRQDVDAWLNVHRPHVVFLAAARVGGILVYQQ